MSQSPQRKLSPIRVILGIILLAAFCGSLYLGIQHWRIVTSHQHPQPWFAPYVDVTARPTYIFKQFDQTDNQNVILSFIVDSPTQPCTATWGGAYTLDQAGNQLNLDRRIARFRQQGGHIGISFGGLLNDELAVTCSDQQQLLNAYQSVIDRYQINLIDLDIEGEVLKDIQNITYRAQTIKQLQTQNPSLQVWITLPVSPNGLTTEGITAVETMLNNQIDLAGVNIMTMNYGRSKTDTDTLAQASKQAITNTHRQLTYLYHQAGLNDSSPYIWSKIGITPMIGQTDIRTEIFTLEDAQKLNQFSYDKQISRISIWSANRDIQCGDNYVNTSIVSDSCSGVKQTTGAFSQIFRTNFTEDLPQTREITIQANQTTSPKIPDNPNQSPYQIWSETGAYLQDTKVVLHHNVYQSKWWTQGDIPDNPVLDSWQTPWQLIGPVLPGEKPIPQPTLPKGTYPEWSGSNIYNTNDRVLFNGIPYQAKWWTQGDSPAATKANPDSSPWSPLRQTEVNALIEEIEYIKQYGN